MATLDLHYWPTPNGKKVTILLEELGADYNLVPCSIGAGDQFKEEFLKINPNHRMPALVDHAPAEGEQPLALFESGAIVIYLAEKFGAFYPTELHVRHTINQWIMWQMANQGPKTGELGHFRRLGSAAGDQSYAIRRFDDEVHRIYGVLNRRLYEAPYLAGNDYSIADMMCYPWASGWEVQRQDISEFPHVERWLGKLAEREGVQKGMAVGSELAVDYSSLPPEEIDRLRKLLYNQRALPVPEDPLYRFS